MPCFDKPATVVDLWGNDELELNCGTGVTMDAPRADALGNQV